MNELVGQRNRLLIHIMNGKRYFSLIPPGDFTKSGLGSYSIHELKDGLETMSLDEIIKAFGALPPVNSSGSKRPSWETDPALRLAMLERLNAIIRQSTEQGERNNAKDAFKRLSGKDWTL